jgi:hypothetical protein
MPVHVRPGRRPWPQGDAVDVHADGQRATACVMGTKRTRNEVALALIKAVHTLAWFSIESCMAYVLYAGAARRTDRRAALAGAVVAGESLLFAANRFRCPLTQLAQNLGAADGSVTDIWLPRWFARNLPAIHVPLLAAAAYLNGRNLRQRQRLRPQARGHQRPEHQVLAATGYQADDHARRADRRRCAPSE